MIRTSVLYSSLKCINKLTGMEAAAYLSSEDRAASVTVVGNTEVPFERSLGRAVGERIQKLFEEKEVKFVNNVNVKEFRGEGGQVTEVRFKGF